MTDDDQYEMTVEWDDKPARLRDRFGEAAVGRFMWWAPWNVDRPWLPRVFRGVDEWHNRSVAVVVPFAGAFIVFHRRGFSRDGEEHVHGYSADGGFEGRVDPSCGLCAEIVDWVEDRS